MAHQIGTAGRTQTYNLPFRRGLLCSVELQRYGTHGRLRTCNYRGLSPARLPVAAHECMVPDEGLEPPRLTTPTSKDGAAAKFRQSGM